MEEEVSLSFFLESRGSRCAFSGGEGQDRVLLLPCLSFFALYIVLLAPSRLVRRSYPRLLRVPRTDTPHSWDEWVAVARLLKYNEDNLNLQKSLQVKTKPSASKSKVSPVHPSFTWKEMPRMA